jgi:hypothetical protein
MAPQGASTMLLMFFSSRIVRRDLTVHVVADRSEPVPEPLPFVPQNCTAARYT